MESVVVGKVERIYEGNNGTSYYTVADLAEGGNIRFSLDGDLPGVRQGDTVKIIGKFQGGNSKNGFFLRLVNGKTQKMTMELKEAA